VRRCTIPLREDPHRVPWLVVVVTSIISKNTRKKEDYILGLCEICLGPPVRLVRGAVRRLFVKRSIKMTTLCHFAVPIINDNDDGWGPPAGGVPTEKLAEIPYAPFAKSDKVGKSADWQGQRNFTQSMLIIKPIYLFYESINSCTLVLSCEHVDTLFSHLCMGCSLCDSF
jgi:hypothetical protein